MMHLHLVFVGKTNFPEIDTAISRYLERLRHYIPVEVHVVRPEKIGEKTSESAVKEKEGERILKLTGDGGCLLIWDQRGRGMDSVEFAKFLERLRDEGTTDLWMVVGGPLGISEKLARKAPHLALPLEDDLPARHGAAHGNGTALPRLQHFKRRALPQIGGRSAIAPSDA